jgi:hypothetical protein
MKKLLAIVLLTLGILCSGSKTLIASDRPIFDQHEVIRALAKIDPTKVKLYLFSIDPLQRQDVIHEAPNFFHGFPVLGKVEIEPLSEKEALLKAFTQGAKESTGAVANCFEPRHGLRIVRGQQKTDFVICYSCLSIDAYGFGPINYFLTSGSPSETFNHLLDQYHIKKASPEN